VFAKRGVAFGNTNSLRFNELEHVLIKTSNISDVSYRNTARILRDMLSGGDLSFAEGQPRLQIFLMRRVFCFSRLGIGAYCTRTMLLLPPLPLPEALTQDDAAAVPPDNVICDPMSCRHWPDLSPMLAPPDKAIGPFGK